MRVICRHRCNRYGIFEALPPGHADSLILVEQIEAACLINYGVALREFVSHVSRDSQTIGAEITAAMQKFLKGAKVQNNRWEYRFAKRFALAYAAACLAIKYDIVSWDPTIAGKAIMRCYVDARAAVPDAERIRSAGFVRLRAKLSGAANVVDLIRSGHNVSWSADEVKAADAFRRSSPDGVCYLVPPEKFFSWCETPLQANIVLAEADRLGLLMKKHPDIRTVQVAINGLPGRRRYYAIREAILTST